MLTVRDLCAQLGKSFKLDRVSLSVAPGQLVAILGPNASGKSSLLRLIAGLMAPRSGEVAWSGRVLSAGGKVLVPPEDRAMSILFQEGVLFPHLTVRENVALGLGPAVPRLERHSAVTAALQTMRIEPLADRLVPRLSGGEQQRVALARALVRRPQVMLLDEPFHSLDATVRRPIISEIRTIVRQQSIAALFVTHDIEEAWELSDGVVLLRDGRKVQQGSMQELYREPEDRWTAEFLGDVVCMEAQSARSWGIGLPDAWEGRRIAFRPEDLLLSLPSQSRPTELVVKSTRRCGAWVESLVQLPDATSIVSRCTAHDELSVGSKVQAQIARALPANVGDDPA